MPTYTGTADANGDFNISFGTNNYTSGEKIIVTAEKDNAQKSIELYAHSEQIPPVISGPIRFSGTLVDYPNNIGTITLSSDFAGTIKAYAFEGSTSGNMMFKAQGLVVLGSITSIEVFAFARWGSAKVLELPATLISIAASAFREWNACLSLVIPNSVTSLGNDCFAQWTSATALTLSNQLTSIPNQCFVGWNALKSLTLPASIITLGGAAFSGLLACDTLTCLNPTPPTIQANTFYNLKSTCIIKVPAASVAAYQAAPNWSAFASRIQAI